jgi:arylsulfatase A-like enzyme
MIDVLPTLLELAGLNPSEVAQGQSLAPLLLGTGALGPRPVIFDQRGVSPGTNREVDAFHIEVVDGRWGASLLVPAEPGAELELPESRIAALQVYDVWRDPNALSPINDDRPDLVEKYRELLEAQWAAHRALAEHVGRGGGESALTPEQLETLRSLGYIR